MRTKLSDAERKRFRENERRLLLLADRIRVLSDRVQANLNATTQRLDERGEPDV